MGFSKKQVILAVKALNTWDKEELLNYCFMNEDSNEQVIDSPSLSSKTENFETMRSKILGELLEPLDVYDDQHTSVQSLEIKYNTIWQRFLDYLDCNFDDFVSLTHLGLVLEFLKSKSKRQIQRCRPVYLDFNVPNLIVCAQDEIINRTLSIYQFTPAQSLPTDDEILFCNSNTTFEEIELFWKRVLFDDNLDSNKKSKKSTLL